MDVKNSNNKKKNKISFLGIVGLGLTTVIGSGIWRDSGPFGWANSAGIFAILALAVSWLLFLTSGLSYAECVSMFPKSGGPYSYVGGAFNKKLGTLVGVTYLIGYFFIANILAFLTANFTLVMFGVDSVPLLLILTIIYLIVFGILAGMTSLRLLGYIAFVWVFLKIIFALIVAILNLVNINPSNLAIGGLTFGGFQSATNNSIWALLGFEVMLIFTEETDKSDSFIKGQLKLPVGILLTLLIIFGLYLIITFGAVSIIGIGDLSGTSPFAIIFGAIGFPPEVLAFFAAFSSAGTTFAVLAVCIHQFRVLARDDSIPKLFNTKIKGFYLPNIGATMAITVILGIVMSVMFITIGGLAIDIIAVIGISLVLISAMLPAGITALYLRIKMPVIRPWNLFRRYLPSNPVFYNTFDIHPDNSGG